MKLALTNGKIYIERDVFAEAVLMEGDKVVMTGTTAEVLAAAGADAEIIDVEGKTVIPGLNDSHQHLVQIGQGFTRPDTAGVTSIDELIQRVKTFIDEKPELAKRGIISLGWNQDLFVDEKRMPNVHDMDKISTEIPIVLTRICGHVGVANTKAMDMAKEMGIFKPVPGGTIEYDENGEPNGIFTESAVEMIKSVIPKPTIEETKEGFLLGAKYALEHGLTSVQSNDVGNSTLAWQDVFQMLHMIYDNEETPLRYHSQVWFHTVEEFKDYALGGEYERQKALNNDYLTVGPAKLFKDGSLGGRTGTMRHEYLDDPGNFGVETTTDEEMDAYCRIADEAGIQVVTHVIGDKAIEDVIGNYERVMRDGKNPLRHALVHCQITDRPMLERIVKDDIMVMYQPVFLDYDMHAVISRCGEELSSTSYAFKTVEELGGHVAYGTDAPVEGCNPFPNIYHAVTRKDKTGWPENGFFPEECVDVTTAIDAYTIGSAYAQFMEDVKGRIKPGFLADMIVLDKDIFTCDPVEIYHMLPTMTIVGGKVVFRK